MCEKMLCFFFFGLIVIVMWSLTMISLFRVYNKGSVLISGQTLTPVARAYSLILQWFSRKERAMNLKNAADWSVDHFDQQHLITLTV